MMASGRRKFSISRAVFAAAEIFAAPVRNSASMVTLTATSVLAAGSRKVNRLDIIHGIAKNSRMDPTRFMTEIFAMWTERNAETRRAAIRAHFHEDIRFFDHDGEFVGHEALENFSDSLQARFPDGRFSLVSPPQALGDGIRAYWRFGPVDGMDFAVLEGDKIKRLYAFVNLPT